MLEENNHGYGHLTSYDLWSKDMGSKKHQEKKLAVAERNMKRLLLNITRRDKIRNEIIRCKSGAKDIIECGA